MEPLRKMYTLSWKVTLSNYFRLRSGKGPIKGNLIAQSMARRCIIPTLGANVANSVTDWRTARQTHSRTPLQREDAMKQVWFNLPSGFGRDSVTDGRADRQTEWKIMLLSHTITMRGSHVASLVKFRPVFLEEIVWRTNGCVYNIPIA